MDVMELRRRLIEAMAKGIQPIKGSITLGDDSNVIEFGKTLSRYMYIIEMSSSSKSKLLETGYNANRMYSAIGKYPAPTIGNYAGANVYTAYRINTSSGGTSYASVTITGDNSNYISGTAIKLQAGSSVSSVGANSLIYGYTYDYTIVPLDNL